MKTTVLFFLAVVLLAAMSARASTGCYFDASTEQEVCPPPQFPVYYTVLIDEPDWCIYHDQDVVIVNHDAYGNALWYYVFPASQRDSTFYYHVVTPYATLMDVSGCDLAPSTAACGDC